MRRKKIEEMIRREADRLTPEPPPFEAISKKVDWDAVAAKLKAPKRNWKPVLLAASGVGILAIGVVSGLAIGMSMPVYINTEGEDDTVYCGRYRLEADVRSGNITKMFDFVGSSLVVENYQRDSGLGQVAFFDEGNRFACTVRFESGSYSSFVFSDFVMKDEYYQGTATYKGETLQMQSKFKKHLLNHFLSLNYQLTSKWGGGGNVYLAE